jgi:hypothetical protein
MIIDERMIGKGIHVRRESKRPTVMNNVGATVS